MTDVRDTLKARAETHGDYSDHARITQMLKNVMASGAKWRELDDHEKETLEMVAHKIGRILSGNPHFHDHWLDIAGYAQLSADRNITVAPLPRVDFQTLYQNGIKGLRAQSSGGEDEAPPQQAATG